MRRVLDLAFTFLANPLADNVVYLEREASVPLWELQAATDPGPWLCL